MVSWTTVSLIAVIVIQWILFTALLQVAKDQPLLTAAVSGADARRDVVLESDPRSSGLTEAMATHRSSTGSSISRRGLEQPSLEGVAVTVMFRAPKWFFLRYQVMLDNALANLPNATTWKVQVFINEPWLQETVLRWHPGLQRLFQDERVIVTSLPDAFLPHGGGAAHKPRHILTSTWFWEAMAADRVLLFSGNGAFCGNAISRSSPPSSSSSVELSSTSLSSSSSLAWAQLLTLDYVGVPSRSKYGGDGSSHSLRYRPAMLRVLQYHLSQNEGQDTEIDGPEDRFFVDTMRRMNQKSKQQTLPSEYVFHVASREHTIVFGGVTNLTTHEQPSHHEQQLIHIPLVVAGTHDELSYIDRESLLKHCPEVKIIFPSLHEPTCFGAHPRAETCRATICALQEPPSSHGC